MLVYLIDGTYELFRQYFGRPQRAGEDGAETGAVLGVTSSIISMLGEGVTHIGVATDHVIESFRNDLWPTYKTAAGVAEDLLAQFPLLEHALQSLGVKVWPMVELEADDALCSAAVIAAEAESVEQVLICSPDKDLAQCVRGNRVVQVDRRTGVVSDWAGVQERFGVEPPSIPDWLALVGDSADGFPGLLGWGKRSASVVLAHYRHIDDIPPSSSDWAPEVLRNLRGAPKLADRLHDDRDLAMLFRDLATLRVDRTLLGDVHELAWTGPTDGFADLCNFLRAPQLLERVHQIASAR